MALRASPPSVSLPEVHGTVPVSSRRGWLRRLLAITGPAYLISVGYMDPGNWATDLAAGSGFGYRLLWVVLMSNVMAVLLQSMAARLGIARGVDLAQACRLEYGPVVNGALYALCELAITACDLAEVLGSAIALQLLFGIPLIWGVLLTTADTLMLLFLTQFGIRKLEALILSLMMVIGGALLFEVILARPDWRSVGAGLAPSIPGYNALFVALGILGATVMPHNLYLHSSLVQTRRIASDDASRWQAIRLNTVDCAFALNVAFLVNAAILVMAAAVFHRSGHTEVADLQQAHRLLDGLLGTAWAPIAFALALLASGQSSTITGTLAGQIVMEGFLAIRIPPWLRRLITRLAAVAPAVVVITLAGERGTGSLLVLSQVILSLQLPFAAVPLVRFVSDPAKMGAFVIGRWLRALAWLAVALIAALNVWLLADVFGQWRAALGDRGAWVVWAIATAAAAFGVLLAYVAMKPSLEWLIRPPLAAAVVGVHEREKGRLLACDEKWDYERVVIALDFSGRERAVFRAILQLLGARRPVLVLLHVVESAPARVLGRDSDDAEMRGDEARLEACAAELRALGFEVQCRLGTGKRVAELARMVNECNPDLLVVAAHGHRFFSDLLHGSTADALRHRVSCSVLVVGKSDSSPGS